VDPASESKNRLEVTEYIFIFGTCMGDIGDNYYLPIQVIYYVNAAVADLRGVQAPGVLTAQTPIYIIVYS